ncbi:hypothetical protein Sango_1892100 [Sesamum angolense]|uniref:DUF4218 domain-containing protein n=1 Tax=Sesamum angolense TaxID=2727404 RepID=A0AAE1WJC2_9LAMI|nr:hypothetical protein Sango_1892100 [Sesamum angolense]
MHIEKNVFDNIFNTVMDIKGKSKDNLNARKDLAIICNHPELQVDERRPNVMPKVVYTLTKDKKKKVCEWEKCLRFPDGYASNLSRCVDDMTELRLHGMKSHDCHIFMQKLIPVAFWEMVPEHVERVDGSQSLFQVLCSTTLDIKKARVGGPVQYRWMYPFERFLRELKKKVKNKAHIEVSIVEAYIVEEIGWFTSHYFEPHVTCKRSRPSRNDDLTREHERISHDIFNHPSRRSGSLKKRYATGQERHMMETYVLCNSEVAAPYFDNRQLAAHSQPPSQKPRLQSHRRLSKAPLPCQSHRSPSPIQPQHRHPAAADLDPTPTFGMIGVPTLTSAQRFQATSCSHGIATNRSPNPRRNFACILDSDEFKAKSAKNKVNRVANLVAASTVYHGGSSSVGMHKRKLVRGPTWSSAQPDGGSDGLMSDVAQPWTIEARPSSSTAAPSPTNTKLDKIMLVFSVLCIKMGMPQIFFEVQSTTDAPIDGTVQQAAEDATDEPEA